MYTWWYNCLECWLNTQWLVFNLFWRGVEFATSWLLFLVTLDTSYNKFGVMIPPYWLWWESWIILKLTLIVTSCNSDWASIDCISIDWANIDCAVIDSATIYWGNIYCDYFIFLLHFFFFNSSMTIISYYLKWAAILMSYLWMDFVIHILVKPRFEPCLRNWNVLLTYYFWIWIVIISEMLIVYKHVDKYELIFT